MATPVKAAHIRRYLTRMDQLQADYWATHDRWLTGDATTEELEAAHTAWAAEWLHGL